MRETTGPGAAKTWLAGAVLALLLSLLASPARAIAWTVPAGVSPSAQDATLTDLAMDTAGRATIAWSALNGPTEARIRRADGSLGPIAVLDGGEVFPKVARDDRGNSYFVWSEFDGSQDRIYFRKLSSTGVLRPTLTLSAPGVEAISPEIAVDSTGDAVVAWQINRNSDPKSQVEIRAVSSTGKRSAIRTMGSYGAQPRVAMDSGGDATIFWWRWHGFDAIQRHSDGAFGSRVQVSTAGLGTHQVMMDSRGDATFLYQTLPIFHPSDGTLYVRRLSQAGRLGPALRVGTVGKGAGTLALNGAGDGLIVWAPRTDRMETLRGRALSATGTLGSVQSISTKGAFAAKVVVNAAGDAVIAWEQAEGNDRTSVNVVERAADGTLGSIHTLSGSTPTNWNPLVGFDDSGQAVATWTRRTDVGRVMMSVGP